MNSKSLFKISYLFIFLLLLGLPFSNVKSNVLKADSIIIDSEFKKVLSNQEINWIQQKQSISVVFHDKNYAPIWAYYSNNCYGVTADFLDLFLKSVNLNVDTVAVSWEEGLKLLEQNKVDLIPSINITNKRKELYLFSLPIVTVKNKIVRKKESQKVNDLKDLTGYVFAVEKGFYTHDLIKQNIVNPAILEFDNTIDAIKSVYNGRTDYYIGNEYTIDYILRTENLDLAIDDFINEPFMNIAFATTKDNNILQSILNKFIASTSQDIIQNIYYNNIFGKFDINKDSVNSLIIDSIKVLNIGYKSFRTPLEFFSNKTLQGIVPEITFKILDNAEIKYNIVLYSDFLEMIPDLQEGKIDMIASLNRTSLRERSIFFSEPYLKLNYIAFGSSERNNIYNIKQINRQKIGVFAAHWLIDELEKQYPNAEFMFYNDFEKLFKDIERNKLDIAFCNSYTYNYYTNSDSFKILEILFYTDYTETCCFAVSEKYKFILPHINRKIAGFDPIAKDQILDKWMSQSPDLSLISRLSIRDYVLIFGLILFVALAVLIHFVQNRKISNKYRRLEEQLSMYKGEMQNVFSYFSDIYFKTDMAGLIINVSPSVLNISGYKPDYYRGKHISEVFYNREEWAEVIESLQNKKSVVDFLFSFKTKTGKKVICSATIKVILDKNDNIEYYEGLVKDFSHRISTQNKIDNIENYLIQCQEFTKTGVTKYRPAKKSISFDLSFLNLLGYNSSYRLIKEEQFYKMIHPHDLNLVKTSFEKILSNIVEQIEFSCRIKTKSGAFVWFNNKFSVNKKASMGAVKEIFGLHTLASSLKTIEEQMISAERMLSTIYKSVPIMLLELDNELSIRKINESVESYSGKVKEEIIGKNLNQVICDNKDRDFAYQAEQIVKNSFEKRENFINQEVKCQIQANDSDDLETKYFLLSTNIYLIEQSLFCLLLIIDATPVIKNQEQLKQNTVLLEKKDKQNQNLIANIISQTQNPIKNVIKSIKSLDFEKLEKASEQTNILKNNIEQLLDIIDNINNLSNYKNKSIAVVSDRIDLAVVLKDIVQQFTEKYKKANVSIVQRLDIPQEIASVYADKEKLQILISNLLKHLYNYMSSGEISLGIDYQETTFRFYMMVDNVKEINFSNSIELTVAKDVAKLIQTPLEFNNDNADNFYCSFVIAGTNEKHKKETNVTIEKQGKTILIVEDEEYNYYYLQKILELVGYDIIVADDGQKAIDTVENNNNIDIILMDIRLPGIDGLEASKRIKAMYPEMPIIAQTAYDLNSEEDRVMEKYCDDYIQKPIVSSELYEKIKKNLKK
ncbi:MAG: transporter substrate-binding domain-containing protein [Bacteroidales bacterium]|nr:transporter substrate-binding domain-containing protein [Bacteroidales bacterium]